MIQKLLTGVMILLLAACGADQAAPTATPEPPTTTPETSRPLVLGDIGDEPAKTIEEFQPLADYLAANLQEQGIGVGEVKVAPDLETMAQWMEAGEVDIYFDSSYPALIVSSESGAQPILRRWKGGVSEYHTVFFTRTDSGLESLDDLPGHSIAFEDDFSTSGYMLPLAYMTEAGLKSAEMAEPDATVADDEVGYVFSGDDDNTIQWVVSNRVDAGVTDNRNYSELPEETRNQLTILAETEALPRQLVIVRPGMDAELVDALTALMTNMDESEEGAAVLATFEKTAQFDEFPGGTDAALERMRELYQLVVQE